MQRMVFATVAAGFVAMAQWSCGTSLGPVRAPTEELVLDVSFERDGQPTLEGWRVINPSLTTLVPEAAPGGGRWSLGLEADWAPTTGFVVMPIPGIEGGDVLRLTAFVRAIGVDGGGSIALAVGPSYELGGRIGQAFTGSTSWTVLSVQDTVTLAPGDTVWVVLSSPHTEVARREGRFDRVRLSRVRAGGG